ncbi:hypothetical protein DPSP01_010960 [Paraphaeosphaeria sporulosa]
MVETEKLMFMRPRQRRTARFAFLQHAALAAKAGTTPSTWFFPNFFFAAGPCNILQPITIHSVLARLGIVGGRGYPLLPSPQRRNSVSTLSTRCRCWCWQRSNSA